MKYSILELKTIIEAIVLKKLKYLVLSGNDYTMMLQINRLIQIALNTKTVQINYSESNINEIKSQLMTKNLFDDIQIIRIIDIPKFVNLMNILSIPYIHFPILIIKTLDKKDCQYFENVLDGCFILCEFDNAIVTKKIIKKLISKANKDIDSTSLEYLTSCLNNTNYQFTINEVDKLINYLGNDSEISLNKIQTVIKPKQVEFNRNKLCSYYAKNNIIEFLKQLDSLTSNGFNIITLIRSLIEYYIHLFNLICYVEAGFCFEKAILQTPIYFRFQTDLNKIINDQSLYKIAKTLQILQNAEVLCKSHYQGFDNYQHLLVPKLALDNIC